MLNATGIVQVLSWFVYREKPEIGPEISRGTGCTGGKIIDICEETSFFFFYNSGFVKLTPCVNVLPVW